MQARAARNQEHNRYVWRKLAGFTFLMFVLPLSTFFGVKKLMGPGRLVRFLNKLDMCMILCAFSGLSAVLIVNIIIGLYVLSAWTEADEQRETVPAVGRFKSKQQ
ncbi:TPA: hypothetical protein N0F65_007236 [Lagenidium giganteum]|uniref:Vacuolar ATPase assembly integral membrane protein VMA21 homolog n=1 Tax=Lagenidium giganteum TaxID=4803 RepID=A0AAV2Z9W2_9STRA|nr:TPA: hypothetical protein N0F65_007236 [Lagenidium giganteum]